MTTIDLRAHRSESPRCKHKSRISTTHAGLRRVVCEQCAKVNVEFVDYADTGILFRVARLG